MPRNLGERVRAGPVGFGNRNISGGRRPGNLHQAPRRPEFLRNLRADRCIVESVENGLKKRFASQESGPGHLIERIAGVDAVGDKPRIGTSRGAAPGME